MTMGVVLSAKKSGRPTLIRFLRLFFQQHLPTSTFLGGSLALHFPTLTFLTVQALYAVDGKADCSKGGVG